MAVAYPSQTPSTAIVVGGSDPWTGLTHTPAAGSDRLLIVVAAPSEGTDPRYSTVTAGGQAMTQIGTGAWDGGWPACQVFYLKEAGIAAMSGNTIAIGGHIASISGAIAFTLTGVDQTTPIGGSQTGAATSGTTAQSSSPVTSTGDGMVIGAVNTDDQGLNTGTAHSHTLVAYTAVINGDNIVGAQRAAGTGGSINLTWTQATNRYAVVTFNVNAVAGGAGPNDLSANLREASGPPSYF